MTNEKICVLAWNHVFVSNTGDQSPCCISQDKIISSEKIKSLQQARAALQSQNMNSFRKKMLDGILPSECKRCQTVEDLGHPSYRTAMNSKYKDDFNQITEERVETTNSKLKYLDIRTGNLCNLKCRMCSPKSSSLLTQEFLEYYGREYAGETDSFFEGLAEEDLSLWSEVRTISLVGGEPLIDPRVVKLLKELIEVGYAKDIELRLNSNLTKLTENLIGLLKEFKTVDIIVSIDGLKSLNHYIRYPSDWDRIHANVSAANRHFQVRFQITVQIYNVFELSELVCFLENQYPESQILFNLLTLPAFLDIRSLPSDLKAVAGSKLTGTKRNHEGMALVANFMNQAAGQQNDFNEFMKWTNFMDRKRGQDIKEVVPELARHFSHG